MLEVGDWAMSRLVCRHRSYREFYGKSPLQVMKNWHKLKPKLLKKWPYFLPACDTYSRFTRAVAKAWLTRFRKPDLNADRFSWSVDEAAIAKSSYGT